MNRPEMQKKSTLIEQLFRANIFKKLNICSWRRQKKISSLLKNSALEMPAYFLSFQSQTPLIHINSISY